MLEQSDIAHYLLSLGVVKPQAVIDEDFRVVDASRRNSVFLATSSAGPTFAVKQALSGDGASLAHEAAVLRLLAGAPELAPHVPAVVCLDGDCLVLRTPGRGRDWTDHRGRFPLGPARVLGRLLAALHRRRVDLPAAPDPLWGLALPEPPYDLVLELSAGAQDLVARIQASDFLCSRLAGLRDTVDGGAFVHGDLRWDNCLAVPAPGAARRTRVVMLDWELAGPCDPAFDVGSVLSEYLRVWVGSVPIVEPVDPGRLVARARHPLASMQPAMQAFWSAYRQPGGPALRRVVELGAVRLLQTAVERAQGVNAPTAHVITLVQLADNMLRRPDAAAFALLGLRP
ncbi:MAG TPA: phosphotransferase [Solirubrobacteraceae bacterium]|jgi:aminoglycoside phosphotransferase (APT) family kinase protein|nr:phosphotransferase [Solirubrobacteraceae bacterium]